MKKLIMFGLSAATALSMTGGALMPIAGAVTIEELQAQIAELTAQLAAMGGSEAGCYAFTVDLSEGSTGADVTALQDYLTGTGHFTFGSSTGYFGSITKAAVAAWQAANGVAPAAGYFGAISRAKYNSICVPGEEEEGPTGLSGSGTGSIDETELVTSLNNEEVGEGEEDVLVYGLEITADDGSDLEFTAAKLVFTQNSGTNEDFGDYADEVSVWFEDEEVARLDAEDFNEDNTYTRNVSFEDGAVLEAGETGVLEIAISGASQIDSDDEGDEWDVDVTSLRFRDADDDAITDTVTEAERDFTFQPFASAANIAFKISEGDEAINDGHAVEIATETDETEDVEVFAFDVEIEGTSDIALDSIPVEATVTGAGHLDEIGDAAYLYMDDELVGSETVPADEETLVFDDLDLTLGSGETYSFVVKMDIFGTGGAIDNGDTVLFVIGETETDSNDFDADDEEGDALADGDVTGSASGEAISFWHQGVSIVLKSVSDPTKIVEADPQTTDSADIGQYVIKFDVSAFGSDIYVGSTTAEDASPDGSDGVEYVVSNTGSNTATGVLTSTADRGASDAFLVEEGETETFTFTVAVTATADEWADVSIGGIGWNLDDDAPDSLYDDNMDAYETDPLYLVIT